MHHKRGKPKKSRSGCLMCKPQKDNAFKDSWHHQSQQEKRSRIAYKEQVSGNNPI